MTGRKLSHFEVLEKLGEGGMGVVYRAFDTHLDRHVAIKILRPDATGSLEHKRRFLREAKAASALNHPNIVHIYDVSSWEETDFIAMEFVPGKTLDRLIGKTGLPLKDALSYAIQIADALERAHSARIVHRDLKPANVIVTGDGRLKLLDFGLAKLTPLPLNSDDATATMTVQTEEGMIIGTVAYMSPEQAEGKNVDVRSDIFSFGSVLYELITGRRPFEGTSKIAMLSAILHKEPPPLAGLVPDAPPALNSIISRCLVKDRDQRAQQIGEIKLALEELREGSRSEKLPPPESKTSLPAPVRPSFPLAPILAGAAVLLVAAGAFWWLKQRPLTPASTQWVQLTNFADSVSQPALSPDGRMLTFIRGPKTFFGPGQIYVKMLPSGAPVQITHDEAQKMSPVFSPDGSRIAYTTVASRVWDTWVVPVLGGEPRLWLPNAAGLVWVDKSKILFSELKDKAFHMAAVMADESRAAARDIYLPPHQRAMVHRSYRSPDAKSFLLVVMNERGVFGPCYVVAAAEGSQAKPVGPASGACTFGAWSPDGEWMYLSSDASGAFHTWRQRFPDGEPEQITSGPTEEEGIAVAPDGRSLVTAAAVRQSSVWLHDSRGDRQISLEGKAFQPKFTPDGKKLLYRIQAGNATELWVADLESNRAEPLLPGFPLSAREGRLTFWAADYDISPDGRQVAFSSHDRGGKLRLWLAPVDRRTPPTQIPNVEGEHPLFGANGEIFFRRIEGTTGFLYAVREDGTGLRRASESPLIGTFGASPDHKWLFIGLVSDAVLFPVAGGSPLSTRLHPPRFLRWTGDGKHLIVCGGSETRPQSYILPLTPGQVLPGSIIAAKGFPSEAELAKWPGVRIIPVGDAVPGPTADVYAFTRESVQRNLYRIPIP